jgi:hypothetical protein
MKNEEMPKEMQDALNDLKSTIDAREARMEGRASEAAKPLGLWPIYMVLNVIFFSVAIWLTWNYIFVDLFSDLEKIQLWQSGALYVLSQALSSTFNRS